MSRLSSALLRRIAAPRATPPGRRRPLRLLNLEDRSVPAVFTVTNTLDDSAPGSLRWAIDQANGVGTADTITFDAGVFSTTKTISLLNELPQFAFDGGAITIAGPGANLLTVRRDAAAPNFRVFDSAAPNTSLTGFTISGGQSDGDGGGLQAGGTIALDRMVFTNNHAVGDFSDGGAIRVNAGGFLSLKNSTLSGNVADKAGGALYFFFGGSLLMENSTISGNTASSGAAAYPDSAQFYGGGALYFFGTASASPPAGFTPGALVIRNSTVANNAATGSGGAAMLRFFGGTLLVQDSTVSGNTAVSTTPGYGGGGFAAPYSSGTFTVTNSVVAGNTNGNSPDLLNPGTTNVNFSAVGSTTGVTLSAGSGNNLVGQTLNLGPLQDNGGPTQTMAPAAGSVLINAGSNALIPPTTVTDQRGLGYTRSFSASGAQRVDIGALEVQPLGLPTAFGTGPSIDTAGGPTTYQFQVTYLDPTGSNNGIAVVTVTGPNANNVIRVTGPNGFDVPATFVSIDVPSNGTPRTATYSITPPGGAGWQADDTGTYSIVILADTVADVDNNKVPAGPVGSFTVAIPNYTVFNAADDGFGSLRQTINDANSDPGPNTITFDPTFFANAATPATTIQLLSTLPTLVNGDLTFVGTGAANVVVGRDPGAATDFGLFFANASATPNLTFDGLTITGGTSGPAGGITGGFGTTTVRNSVVTGNAGFIGGGIAIPGNGSLVVQNSTVSGNTGPTGGIYFLRGGNLLLENSTVSGNTGTSDYFYHGGGIVFYGTVGAAGVTIVNSTIDGNSTASTSGGGGLNLANTFGAVSIRNSTITGNTAPAAALGGGGVGVTYGNATLDVTNTIVAGNTGPADSPDLLVSNGSATGTNNLFGVAPSINYAGTGDLSGSVGAPLDPLLGPLADNGGLTLTRAPLAGSPALDAGSDAATPPAVNSDQRGFGYARRYGGTVDIGAVEFQPPGTPFAAADAPAVTVADAGETTYTFTVTYADVTGPAAQRGLDLTTIVGNDGAVRVTGPNGYDVAATYVGIDGSASTTVRTATYSIVPPGGSWDAMDSGLYPITLVAGAVTDVEGNAVPDGAIGGIDVFIPNYTVFNAADAGFGSLRQTIADANRQPGLDTITFDPAFFGTGPHTITLQTALPQFTAAGGDVVVDGPGAALLTVARDAGAAPFGIIDSAAPTLTMSGLTLTGGQTDNGNGGGLHLRAFTNTVLDGVVVTGNAAVGNAIRAGSGGGVGVDEFAFLTVRESTVSGNTAERSGGGIYFLYYGSLVVENSTISGNATTTADPALGGGGIYFYGPAAYYAPPGYAFNALVIRNSTIADNTTAGSGGGIAWSFALGTLQVENSTISGNTADAAAHGGGISVLGINPSYYPTINIVNSIVSGNTNVNAPDIYSLYPVYANFSAIGDLDALVGFTLTGGADNLDVDDFADLLLTDLGDYGGPTQTFAIRAGSPLIDAGDAGAVDPALTNDQRGDPFVRVYNGAVDIGATEFQPPTVTVEQAANQGDPTNSPTILFTVTFSGPVTDFDDPLTDLAISGTAGATTAVISGSGAVYTVAVSGMTADGTVVLDVRPDAALDAVGTPNGASTSADNSVTYDATGPTAAVEQAAGQPDPTNVSPVRFTVTFSEEVAGFDASDITLTGTYVGAADVSVVRVPGPGVIYSITVANLSGEGTIVPTIAAGSYTDLATNPGAASTSTDNSVTFDNVGPRVTINQGAAQGDPTNATTIVFDVVFSEPVSDFTAADVSLAGSTNGGAGLTAVVSGSGTTYTVAVQGMVNNDVVVAAVLGGGTTDALGNVGSASTSTDNSVTFDNAGPTATLNQAAGQADPATLEPILFTAVFSEPVSGFTAADIVITGTSTGGVASLTQVNATTYTVSVSGMTSSGTVVVNIPAGSYTDLATNPGAASTSTDNSVGFLYGGSFVLDAATYTRSEDGGSLVVTVSRTGGTEGIATVNYATGNGTATAGADYTTTTGTLTFAAGVGGTQTFTIPILDDRVIEGDETFTVTLSNPTSSTGVARLGTPSTAVVTIADVEEGEFNFSAPVVNVGENAGTATITVTRTNGTAGAVSVNYAAVAGTAHTGGAAAAGQNDFTPVNGTLTWAAGVGGTQTFTIPILEDTLNEGTEWIGLSLTTPTGNTIVGAAGAAKAAILPSDGTSFGTVAAITTDSDGDTATLKLTGGGTGVFYRTDPDGDTKGPIELIEVSGTLETKSALSVAVKKLKTNLTPDAGKIGLGGVTGTTLKSISAKTAYLNQDAANLTGGGVNLSGFLGALSVGDVLGGADIITGASANPKAKTNITAGVIADGTAVTVGSPINALTATKIGVGTIAAPSAASITTKGATKPAVIVGDLGSTITLTGVGVAAGKTALGKLSVAGSVLAGADVTAPSVGTVSVKNTLAGDLILTGAIKSLTAGAITGSTIAANSLGTLKVVGNKKIALAADMTGSTLTLAGTGVPTTKPTLGTFSVAGTVMASNVSVGGNVTTVSALRFIGSNFYAGYTGDEAGAGSFLGVAAVKTFSVKGGADAYQDSNLIATSLGTVTFKSVKTNNGGTKFGVVVHTAIKSLKVTTPPFTYNTTGPVVQTLGPDFEVKRV